MTGLSDVDLQATIWQLQYQADGSLEKPMEAAITSFQHFQQRVRNGETEINPVDAHAKDLVNEVPNGPSIERRFGTVEKIWRNIPEHVKATAEPNVTT